METDAKIDWLSFTLEPGVGNVQLDATTGRFEDTGVGRHGYRKQARSDTGVFRLSEGETAMGTHYIYSAHALENTRNNGVDDRQLCQLVLALSGKATRLDLALDILNGTMTVQDLETAYFNREIKTVAKTLTRTTSFPKGGDTVYIGSRVSERMLRGYNKAIEQNIVDGSAWLRLELEIKKLRARATLWEIANNPQTRWVINRAFRDFVDWDNDEYRLATDDNFASIADVPRKMPNLLHWLQTQVAPAAARYQNEHPGVDIRAMLNQWISDRLIDSEDSQ